MSQNTLFDTTNSTNAINSHQNSNSKSYSSALSQVNTRMPTKEQAIVFTSIDGFKIQDYLLQLGPLVNPKNILYCSRISNNRICIYLSDKNGVDKFLNDYGSVAINGTVIPARRLITPSERLLLSNVSPTIPNELLVFTLENMGLKVMSPMSSLRINANDPAYSHILSFRRQIYISPPDNIHIPEYIELEYDDVQYRIYLSKELHTCFKCKQAGHNASQCVTGNNDKSIPSPLPERSSTSNEILPSIIPNAHSTSQQSQSLVAPATQTNPMDLASSSIQTTSSPSITVKETESEKVPPKSNSSIKRSASEILTPTSENTDINFTTPREINTKKHKIGKGQQEAKIDMPETIRNFINNHSPPFSLNSQQLENLLIETYGTRDVLTTVKDYTSDPLNIVTLLDKIHPLLAERKIKIRCTKLKGKILKQLQNNTLDTDSDSSTF